MRIYFTLDENKRLNGYSSSPMRVKDEVYADVPDNHEVLSNSMIFKYENGELIKDEAYQQQLINEEQAKQEHPSDDEMNAIAIMELTKMFMGGGV